MNDTRAINIVVHAWYRTGDDSALSLRCFPGGKGGEDFFDLKKNGFKGEEEVVLISKAQYNALKEGQMEKDTAVLDVLHPTGRCTCADAGTCPWCAKICQRCGGDGVEPQLNPEKRFARVAPQRITDTEGDTLEFNSGYGDGYNNVWICVDSEDPRCRILQFDYDGIVRLRDLCNEALAGPSPTPPNPTPPAEELDVLLRTVNADD